MQQSSQNPKPMRARLSNRFSRFAIVGLSNTVVSYIVFVLLFYSDLFAGPMHTPLSQAMSYLAGIIWSFLWNRHWAFRQNQQRSQSLWPDSLRFVALQVSCLLLSVAFVTLLVDHLAFAPELGWVMAMIAITAINFLAMHYWVFPLKGNPTR